MIFRWAARAAGIITGLACFPLCSDARAETAPQAPPVKEVSVAANAFLLGAPIPSWVEKVTIPEANTGGSFVVRLADTQLLAGSEPVIFAHFAVAINDPAALNNAGQIPIQFIPQYQKLQLHGVYILRGSEKLDRTKSSSVRFLQRETGLDQGIYTDVVTASILVNDLRVGDTLEYSYSRYGQNPVFGGKFVEDASWDQPNPILLRRVAVNHPVARKLAWRVVGDRPEKALTPTESVAGGMRKLVFEETDLQETGVEQYTPPDYVGTRWLHFSEFSSWDEVVAWAMTLFQAGKVTDRRFEEVVEKLRALATDEERVAGALEFVQSEIRYFSVALGESSHRPAQPDVVLQHRYGDCKDKSLLLVTLLKELGIESKPALLSVARRKGLDQSLPSPEVFDHAIVQVTLGGKVYYLDPTRLGQYGRLDRMGQPHEGVEVLVVSPETRGPVSVASPNALDLARSEAYETVTLSEFGGTGQLEVKQIWKGASAEAFRVAIQQVSRERLVKSFSDIMEQRYPGAKVVGEPKVDDNRLENRLTITTRYDVPKIAQEQDGFWYVRFSPDNLKGTLVAPPSSDRVAPLGVPEYPFEGKYSFEVRFPPSVRILIYPRTQAVRGKHFTYTTTSAFTGNVAKATVSLKTLADRVEPQDLQKYSDDLRATDKATLGVIVVPKKFIRSKKVAGSNVQKEVTQAMLNSQKDAINNTTQAIKSGKLAGNDLAASYCSRGVAYSYLGRANEALRDAEQAFKIAPNSPDIASCRAGVYFMSGDFEKSVSDYSKALSLGATDENIFRQRGVSNYYAGKLDAAAEDFSKASADGDQNSQPYSDIWLIRTYQRLGKPIPEDLAKRAASQPRGDWPRPALATMGGALAPEEMLKILEKKSGEDRQMASAEGYFYLGQYYLGLGDTTKARDYFERTRKLNVIAYLEHIAAGYELKDLKPEPTTTSALPEPSAGTALATPGAPFAGSAPKSAALPGAGSGAAEQAKAPPASAATPTAPSTAAAKPSRPKKAAKRIDPNWNTKLFQP